MLFMWYFKICYLLNVRIFFFFNENINYKVENLLSQYALASEGQAKTAALWLIRLEPACAY